MERLPEKSVSELRAQRVQPEIAGFGTMKLGENIISFMAHSWLEGEAVTTLRMIDAMGRGESHAIVEAVLNDNVRVPMVVDTGAGPDVISPSLVEKLKLPLFDTGDQTMIVRGMGGEQPAFPGGLSKLRLGGVLIHNTVVVVLTEQYRDYTLGLFRGPTVDNGILGLNSLGRFRWVTLDWRRRTVTLGRKGDYAPDPKKLAEAVPFTVEGGKLFVSAELGGLEKKEPVKLMLDTGSDDYMMMPMATAQKLELFAGQWPPANQRWITGLGGSYVGTPFVVPTVQVGKLRFIRVSGHTTPKSGVALMGNRMMRRHKITLDFARRRLIFERP